MESDRTWNNQHYWTHMIWNYPWALTQILCFSTHMGDTEPTLHDTDPHYPTQRLYP